MKQQKYGIARITKATANSVQGLHYAWKNESAFREETVVGSFLIIAAFFFGESHLETAILIASCFLVVITEVLNSAIEAVVDRIGTEHHELSGAAKDMGSAAVMLSLIVVIITWALLLSN